MDKVELKSKKGLIIVVDDNKVSAQIILQSLKNLPVALMHTFVFTDINIKKISVKKLVFVNINLGKNIQDFCFSLAKKDGEIKVLKIGGKWVLEKENTRIVFLEKCFFIPSLSLMTKKYFFDLIL